MKNKQNEIVTEIAFLMEEQQCAKGQSIISVGDEQTHIIFIAEGEVDILLKSDDKQSFLLDKLRNNSSFGYHAVMKLLNDKEEPPV
jgi:CRP-like cAMP-binding protein